MHILRTGYAGNKQGPILKSSHESLCESLMRDFHMIVLQSSRYQFEKMG